MTFTNFVMTALVAATGANAWFRLPCTGPLVTERVDPIVSPGTLSQHIHTVHGGSNFGLNTNYNTLRQSRCTSCEVQEDLSNYWFPKLYYHDNSTGKFEAVPNGGLLIYYQNRGTLDVSNGGPGLKAFPPGFRMLSGNAKKRSQQYTPGSGGQAELAERAIEWLCLRYTANQPGYSGPGGFPTTDCEAGFQSRVHFPACWDGVNLDSPDHKSHVAFLDGLDNGACPPGYPVGLMKLFYEVTWDITGFASRWNPTSGGKWPFVWATGDPTGYSFHGDFLNGWDQTALQDAIDKCNNPNDQTINGVVDACSYLHTIDASTADNCNILPVTKEKIDGVTKLPGCNPIQTGPGDATLYSTSTCPI